MRLYTKELGIFAVAMIFSIGISILVYLFMNE